MNRDVALGFSRDPSSVTDEADRTHSLASGVGHSPTRDFESTTGQSDHGVLRYWQVSNDCLSPTLKHLMSWLITVFLVVEVVSSRPSGQIEPQPRDSHFSQGTCNRDIVRMVATSKEKTAPTYWALSEAVSALHFDHTEISGACILRKQWD